MTAIPVVSTPAGAARGPDSLRRIARSPTAVTGLALTSLMVALAVFNRVLAPGYAFATSPDRLAPPSRTHLMGTDHLGRDVFTAVVQGAHSSLKVVFGVVVIAAVIGVAVGAAAGSRGGVVDDVVTRITEMVQTVPRFFLAVLVVGWFGPGRPLTVLLGLTSWPFLARIVRAETLSLREREFVRAARSLGASEFWVLTRHIVPNVLPAVAVVVALTGSRVVLLEAGLAFLGLTDVNVPSWGALINNAQAYLADAWWLSVFPGLAIATSVVGMNLLADGLSEAFRPTATQRRAWTAGGEASLGG